MDLIKKLDALGDVGAGPNGISRVAGTTADDDAKMLVSSWIKDAGMRVTWDDDDNIVGYLKGDDMSLPPIVVGSHIDTVVDGGKYDGALGIVAGIEAAKALTGKLRHPLQIVAFHDEERTMDGSKAFAAKNDPYAFLELHVEQGPDLERFSKDIGVVTGIVGQRRVKFTVFGEPNHGGTTPMDLRDDALYKASKAVTWIFERALEHPTITATVGQLEVSPNKFSIVPGRVDFTVQIRDVNSAEMDLFLQSIIDEFGFAYETTESQEPVVCAQNIMDIIHDEATSAGLGAMLMPSRAGHDAQVFTCPMGMIFVPSRGGISHSQYEYTSPDQCYNGLRVLIETIRRIDNE